MTPFIQLFSFSPYNPWSYHWLFFSLIHLYPGSSHISYLPYHTDASHHSLTWYTATAVPTIPYLVWAGSEGIFLKAMSTWTSPLLILLQWLLVSPRRKPKVLRVISKIYVVWFFLTLVLWPYYLWLHLPETSRSFYLLGKHHMWWVSSFWLFLMLFFLHGMLQLKIPPCFLQVSVQMLPPQTPLAPCADKSSPNLPLFPFPSFIFLYGMYWHTHLLYLSTISYYSVHSKKSGTWVF